MNNLGIHSKVHAVAKVEPENASLFITLSITAKNETPNILELVRPYCLPEIEGVFDFRASDQQGDLDTVHPGPLHGVRFRPNTSIPPYKDYTWTVAFRCPGRFRRVGRNIAGPYRVTVQNDLCGCPVNRHDFVYDFVFPKPKPWLPRLFRTVNVIQVNTRSLPAAIAKRYSYTKCTLTFSLLGNEDLRVILATSYDFSSLAALSIAVVSTVVAQEYAIGVLLWLWHAIRHL